MRRVPERPFGRPTRPAYEFVSDLKDRLRHRVQLTTDGHRPYLSAVEDAFGADVDYAMLQKIYGTDAENERRYSPARCIHQVRHDHRRSGPGAHFDQLR